MILIKIYGIIKGAEKASFLIGEIVKYDRKRAVGEEASKTYLDNIDSGFFDDYMQGEIGLDIGGVGYLTGTTSILETARIIDLDTPGYDGITLPYENASVDYIFSSHCLEHIPTSNVLEVLRDWYRVLKIDSCMVITVPSEYRYEKQLIDPENGRKSRYNEDHHRGYTPAKLLAEIESAFEPNSYVIELCRDHYKGWDRNTPPEIHSGGQYEVLVVLRKCEKPDWELR